MPRKKRKYTKASAVGAGAAKLVHDLRAYHGKLVDQQAALEGEVAAITQALNAMGGVRRGPGRPPGRRGPGRPLGRRGPGRPPGRRGPGRPPGRRGPGRPVGRPPGSKAGSSKGFRPGSLKDSIMKVLNRSGGSVAVKNISARLKTVGYKTKSKSLGNQVTMALREMPGVTKVGRGLYAARGR